MPCEMNTTRQKHHLGSRCTGSTKPRASNQTPHRGSWARIGKRQSSFDFCVVFLLVCVCVCAAAAASAAAAVTGPMDQEGYKEKKGVVIVAGFSRLG